MECSLSPSYSPKPAAASSLKSVQSGRGSPKSSLHVNFDTDKDELQERKKKYLTARYGQHQMSLIKKRLRVEMWMYEQLQFLYGSTDDNETHEVEIDLDELLDIEDERLRREWLRRRVVGTKEGSDKVERFIDDLLQRAKTL